MKPVVLLVHRGARQREFFRDALEQGGFEAYAVPDGRAALTSFPDIEPDVVVLDGVNPMPAVAQFCKELRSLSGRREIPVLVTNDLHRGADYHRQTRVFGAAAVLERGYTEDDLARALWELVEGGEGGRPRPPDRMDSGPAPSPGDPPAGSGSGPRPGEDDFVFEAAPPAGGRGRDGVRFYGAGPVEVPGMPGPGTKRRTELVPFWKDRRVVVRPLQIGVLALFVGAAWWLGSRVGGGAGSSPSAEAPARGPGSPSPAAPVPTANPSGAAPRSATTAPLTSPVATEDKAARSAPAGASSSGAAASKTRPSGSPRTVPPAPARRARVEAAVPAEGAMAGSASGRTAASADSAAAAPSSGGSGAAAPAPREGEAHGALAAGTVPAEAEARVPDAAATERPALREAAGKSGETSPDLPPMPLSRPIPEYPPTARQLQVHGEVLMQVQVLADGKVGEVRVLRSPSPVLAEAAAQAARKWRYRPGSKGGLPVDAWRLESIAFEE